MIRTKNPKPPKCRYCKARMPPELARQALHDECVSPWWTAESARKERNRVKAEKAAKLVERRADAVKRQSFKTIAELIADAQVPFNLFIRRRDAEKGCFVCNHPFLANVPGRVQHAGHVRSRGAAGHLRFNEDNCHGECEGCNGPHGAKPHQIEAGAVARIGQARFDALKANNNPRKWTREELIAIKTTYAAKARALKGKA